MSLVISADTQRLSGSWGSPVWTVQTEFSIAVWVKVTAAQWGDIFTMTDGANPSYSNIALRTAGGTTYDHSVALQSADMRMSAGGAVSGGWDLVVLTYKQGVARISYRNGSAAETVTSGMTLDWRNGVGFDTIFFGYFATSAYGQHSGRMKIAHGAVWDKALTSTEESDLYNGGAGGAGKNPQDVAAANLKFYAALTSDATVAVGGITLTATGAVAYDADNPSVDAAGGGPLVLVVNDGSHAHAADNLALTIIGTLSIADAAHAHAADSITLTATTNGTITIPAVRDWGTKALKTGQTGVQVDIRNIATGALVVRKTGQTTHATTGVCVVTDAAIVAGTTYEVVTRFADGSRGMWDYTAS